MKETKRICCQDTYSSVLLKKNGWRKLSKQQGNNKIKQEEINMKNKKRWVNRIGFPSPLDIPKLCLMTEANL
jgi:hypothetical protein